MKTTIQTLLAAALITSALLAQTPPHNTIGTSPIATPSATTQPARLPTVGGLPTIEDLQSKFRTGDTPTENDYRNVFLRLAAGANKTPQESHPGVNDSDWNLADRYVYVPDGLTYEIQADGSHAVVSRTSYQQPGTTGAGFPTTRTLPGFHVSTAGELYQFDGTNYELVSPDAINAAIDANAANVTTNTTAIATNAASIGTNATNVTSNAAGVASNAAAISDIEGRVFQSISTLEAVADGETSTVLGYRTAGDSGPPWKLTYHATGRTGVTVDGGFYLAGGLADDYWEAVEKGIAVPERFGAKDGDNTHDSTAAIQAAINAAPTIRFAKPGSYYVTGELLATDRERIDGNGATITATASHDDVLVVGGTTETVVTDLTLDGGAVGVSGGVTAGGLFGRTLRTEAPTRVTGVTCRNAPGSGTARNFAIFATSTLVNCVGENPGYANFDFYLDNESVHLIGCKSLITADKQGAGGGAQNRHFNTTLIANGGTITLTDFDCTSTVPETSSSISPGTGATNYLDVFKVSGLKWNHSGSGSSWIKLNGTKKITIEDTVFATPNSPTSGFSWTLQRNGIVEGNVTFRNVISSGHITVAESIDALRIYGCEFGADRGMQYALQSAANAKVIDIDASEFLNIQTNAFNVTSGSHGATQRIKARNSRFNFIAGTRFVLDTLGSPQQFRHENCTFEGTSVRFMTSSSARLRTSGKHEDQLIYDASLTGVDSHLAPPFTGMPGAAGMSIVPKQFTVGDIPRWVFDTTSSEWIPDTGSTLRELSSDPADPGEGKAVMWQSNGTGTGDDGDVMLKVTAGGTTKTITIVDFSAF